MSEYGRTSGLALPRMTPAVKALLLINGGVFLINALLTGELSDWLGVSLDGVIAWLGLGAVRLVTYQFVHSFEDPGHILFNMLTLYFFGTMVEEGIGGRRLVKLYLSAGLVGGGLQVLLLGLLGHPERLIVGASGACYGIVVYAACMAPRAQVLFLIVLVELRWLALILVLLGVYMMYVELATGTSSGVAHTAHVGGALWGWIAYRLPARRSRLWDQVERWRAGRSRAKAHERQEILDRLLDKVHREGISALTSAERKFLDRTSEELRRR